MITQWLSILYDDSSRIYITTVDLSGLSLQQGYYYQRELYKKTGRKRINSLVKDLSAIKGISEMYVAPNYFKIWIRKEYDWDDVEPAIVEILEEALFRIKIVL